MFTPRIRAALLAVSASVAVSACAYGPYGGMSAGYGNYGGYDSPYYGTGYGYGSPYYGTGYGYGSPYYGAGYGYGSPYYYGNGQTTSYYGWHNDYYYPGTGIYVYGKDGRQWEWSESQRRYWEARRTANPVENWNGYGRPRPVAQSTASNRVANATTPRTIERQAVRGRARTERLETRRATQGERRAAGETRRDDGDDKQQARRSTQSERRAASETRRDDRSRRRSDD